MLALALAASGCATLYDPSAVDEQARSEMTIQTLQVQVNQLQERVNDMEAQRQDLYERMHQLEAGIEAGRRDEQQRLAALESSVGSMEAARQRDREQIVDQLSKKMADVVRTTGGGSGGGSRSADGYEHVVQQGETLSAIAAAYKVKPSAIIEANGLKNANNLRVGQKLFIPE